MALSERIHIAHNLRVEASVVFEAVATSVMSYSAFDDRLASVTHLSSANAGKFCGLSAGGREPATLFCGRHAHDLSSNAALRQRPPVEHLR